MPLLATVADMRRRIKQRTALLLKIRTDGTAQFAQRTLPTASRVQITQVAVIAFFSMQATVEWPAKSARLDPGRMLSDLSQDSACRLAERTCDLPERTPFFQAEFDLFPFRKRQVSFPFDHEDHTPYVWWIS